MTIPYDFFPTWDEWKTDSHVSGYSYDTWRVSDPLLQVIDGLVQHYNDPNHVHVQIETLFYLYGALDYWLDKLNKQAANRGETRDNITGQGLPASVKVSGHKDRKLALQGLKVITGELLAGHTNTNAARDAIAALEPNYARQSHGVGTAQDVGSDLWTIAKFKEGEIAVFLQEKHLQRRYKLRFRNGKTWRWDPAANENRVYDTTDDRESEKGDGTTHFVMNTRGHIFAGFNTQVTWFKHSSLIGGANTYSAGRIRIKNGVVTEVLNDSGHYEPGVVQMRNVLRRLQIYGQDVSSLKVTRFYHRTAGKASFPGAAILTCGANWPDGASG